MITALSLLSTPRLPFAASVTLPAPQSADNTPATQAVDFLLQAYQLKHEPRRLWAQEGITPVESVASHSWGVSLLVLQYLPKGLDMGKALAYVALHDLAEVITGDITPRDGISLDEKNRREREAMNVLCGKFPALKALWEKYQAKADLEAKFVKEADSVDLALQTVLALKAPGKLPLSAKTKGRLRRVLHSVDSFVTHPNLKPLMDGVYQRFTQLAQKEANL